MGVGWAPAKFFNGGGGGGQGLTEFVALGHDNFFMGGGVCKKVPPTLPPLINSGTTLTVQMQCLSQIKRKPVLGVFNQASCKPVCTVTKASCSLELSNIETRGTVKFLNFRTPEKFAVEWQIVNTLTGLLL